MKIVNRSGVPESLFKYLLNDTYDYSEKGNSISATELLKPLQACILKRRYDSLLEMDAIDRLWSLLGSGVHAILEDEKGIEKIERLKTVVEGREVSGKFDRIFNNKITDYKVTSAWTVVFKSREPEWIWQLSIYRWLYFKAKGVTLDETGSIVAILRDWSEKNSKTKDGRPNDRYPKAPAVELNYRLHSLEDTEKHVTELVKNIIRNETVDDARLPECSDEDRWYNKDKKVYMRCAKYCEVNKFCKQFERENIFESIEVAEVA